MNKNTGNVLPVFFFYLHQVRKNQMPIPKSRPQKVKPTKCISPSLATNPRPKNTNATPATFALKGTNSMSGVRSARPMHATAAASIPTLELKRRSLGLMRVSIYCAGLSSRRTTAASWSLLMVRRNIQLGSQMCSRPRRICPPMRMIRIPNMLGTVGMSLGPGMVRNAPMAKMIGPKERLPMWSSKAPIETVSWLVYACLICCNRLSAWCAD